MIYLSEEAKNNAIGRIGNIISADRLVRDKFEAIALCWKVAAETEAGAVLLIAVRN